MNKFQFTKKNAVALLILLLIAISLVKPSILKNMKNHILGRLLLIFILVLFISYNVSLGLTCVFFFIILHEYYDNLEGMDNMTPPPNEDALSKISKNTTDKPASTNSIIQAPESTKTGGASSVPATVPKKETHDNVAPEPSKNAITIGQKTDLDSAIKKHINSNVLPMLMNKDSSKVKPATSVSDKKAEGFVGNMSPLGWAPF
jgi:hypothetical protein